MKAFCILLSVLSLTAGKVYPRTGVNDALDGVDGIYYDVPDYEHPEVSLFKLIAEGILPVYTLRDAAKDLSNKDDKTHHYERDDIIKGLDAVISQLQEAKNKMENGKHGIHFDIDKSVLSLKDIRDHLPLHSIVTPSVQSSTPDSVTEDSSTKVPTDKYSILKSSVKKYLSSGDSMFKSISFDIPNEKLPSFDTSVLPYNTKTAPEPLALPKLSVQQSSASDQSAGESIDVTSFKGENLPALNVQPLFSTTKQPSAFDKDTFKFQFLRTEIPPVEESEKKKDESYDVDDDYEEQLDKVEQEDKTLIRKKWTWKS